MGTGGDSIPTYILHNHPMVVQVTGLGVKKELTISLEELKTRFKKHEVVSGFCYSDHSIAFKRLWPLFNAEETEGRR